MPVTDVNALQLDGSVPLNLLLYNDTTVISVMVLQLLGSGPSS